MNFPDVGVKNEGGVSKEFLIKMKDKEKIQGVFQGDPSIFRTHWNGTFSERCPGKDKCPICQLGDPKKKAKFRFRINFVMRKDGNWTPFVFENSYDTYLDMKSLHESGYNLSETMVMITRSGAGQNDTRYSILPVPQNGGLKPDDLRAMMAIKLHDLGSPKAEDQKNDSDDVPSSWDEPGAGG